MSLLDAMMEDFVVVNKSSVSDGEGGLINTWTDGATIKAILTCDTTMQAKRAEKEGVTSTYKLTTNKDVKLDFHTVVRRVSDNRTFRTTTDYGDVKTPSISDLDMAQVSAEKWEIPT